MHLFENQSPEIIDWWGLSKNPSIFVYDYTGMKESKKEIHEKLMQKMFQPKNIPKFKDWGFPTVIDEE
jgi:hypothetical protein